MNTHEKAYAEAEIRRRHCADWLKKFMRPGQPKPATKDELYAMARQELKITRRNFDDGWIMAIEETGRHDWYKGLPAKRRTQS